MEQPIFHHLERRTQTHSFLCALARHQWVAMEKRFLDGGAHTSWRALRQPLRARPVVIVVLPTATGRS
jgi:hypothetical protein